MIDGIFILLSIIIFCLAAYGLKEREIMKREYSTYCKTIYYPELQTLDKDKILLREKHHIDRGFDMTPKGISEIDEMIPKNNIIYDKRDMQLKTGVSSLYPERGSRTDPYY
tara:strand:- start:410 stop:742 length:333 start_codon:yes stop_codon:yes gene_type:complete